jgi:hypothetical protein
MRLKHQVNRRRSAVIARSYRAFRVAFGYSLAYLASRGTSYNQEAGDSAIRPQGRQISQPEVELDSTFSGSVQEPIRDGASGEALVGAAPNISLKEIRS